MHLFLDLLFSVHGSGKGQVHVVRVVLSDVYVLQRLPVYSVADRLPGRPEGWERIQPFVRSKNLPDVSRRANVPLAVEGAALLFQVLDSRLILDC